MRSEQDKTCNEFYQTLKKYLFVRANSKEKIHTTKFGLESNKSANSEPTEEQTSPAQIRSKTPKKSLQNESVRQTRSSKRKEEEAPEESKRKEEAPEKSTRPAVLLAQKAAKKGTHDDSVSAKNCRQKLIEKTDEVTLRLPKPRKTTKKRKLEKSNKPQEHYDAIIEDLFIDHSSKLNLKPF